MTESSVEDKDFLTSLILISGYLLLQILANLTVSKQTPVYSDFAIPVGSLLWAITFTWIDLVNDHLGKYKARLLVVISIVANVLMIFWFEFYIWVPGSAEWYAKPEKQLSIEFVLGGYWRIYVASIITNFVCENLDISIFHYIKHRHPLLPRWARSMISNSFSAPLDGFLFASLAFWGVLPTTIIFSIIVTSALYKLSVAYISIPMLYLVKSRHY